VEPCAVGFGVSKVGGKKQPVGIKSRVDEISVARVIAKVAVHNLAADRWQFLECGENRRFRPFFWSIEKERPKAAIFAPLQRASTAA
jgi:hypothetical protein